MLHAFTCCMQYQTSSCMQYQVNVSSKFLENIEEIFTRYWYYNAYSTWWDEYSHNNRHSSKYIITMQKTSKLNVAYAGQIWRQNEAFYRIIYCNQIICQERENLIFSVLCQLNRKEVISHEILFMDFQQRDSYTCWYQWVVNTRVCLEISHVYKGLSLSIQETHCSLGGFFLLTTDIIMVVVQNNHFAWNFGEIFKSCFLNTDQ